MKESRLKTVDKLYGTTKGNYNAANPQIEKATYISLVGVLQEKDLLSVVFFTFSRQRCESNADALSNMDLTTKNEKSAIRVFYDESIRRLSIIDRSLPQVSRTLLLINRGIGVHHRGLLPIIKEMIEMLFAKGLIKVLFATETFAMGVNMPARSVVFDSIRKHDGNDMRDLLPGEYIQMAGRAGRRGLDKTGTVIIVCKNEVPILADLKLMMLGKPTTLNSKFRLTYNMILNLLRVEQLRIEDMMKRSFGEWGSQKDSAHSKARIIDNKRKLETIESFNCDICDLDLEKYHETCIKIERITASMYSSLFNSTSNKLIGLGQLMIISTSTLKNVPALFFKIDSVKTSEGFSRTMITLMAIHSSSSTTTTTTLPPNVEAYTPPTDVNVPTDEDIAFSIITVPIESILRITTTKMQINKLDIVDRPTNEARLLLAMNTCQILRNPNALSHVDMVKEYKLNCPEIKEKQQLEQKLNSFQCCSCPLFRLHLSIIHSKAVLTEEIILLRDKLSDDKLRLLPEYRNRLNVLRALNYIDNDDVIQLKGRVACEITTCDEIIGTELVFSNALTKMEPAEIVALLSCLIFEQKRTSEPHLTPPLKAGLKVITDTAVHIAETQLASGLRIPVEEYLEQIHTGLVEVVYEWASGMPFAQITGLTDVLEGSIVRCIVRLDETCRDIRNAAHVIGDPLLEQKMHQASTMIKRDIVFAASLYTSK